MIDYVSVAKSVINMVTIVEDTIDITTTKGNILHLFANFHTV